jgi:integrase
MKIPQSLLPLFQQFIKDSQTGKRLKKNGEKIKQGTIDNYKYTYTNLERFVQEKSFDLRICDHRKLTKRERLAEKNYWKKFYKKFTAYLYSRGCYDNYVGANIKQIRTFFNYLELEKDIFTGGYHKSFYVRKEAIDILVLSPEQLKFLIHDKAFEMSLSKAQCRVKDIFVFGCTTGLRFSDIFQLTNKNFEVQNGVSYVKIKSKKTKVYSYIKLPQYAEQIYNKHKSPKVNSPVFGKMSLFIFNRSLKLLGEKAGFTNPVQMTRERLGQTKNLKSKQIRFCDKMSSHMMRRTAITTLLILGMPEHLVRKVSGHSSSSQAFNRYVHYAQTYVDKEIDKIHHKLENY